MKKGFVAASVEDIAAAAGYTRGAFYSNFRSKSELLIELLRRDHETMQAALQAIFENAASREQMEAGILRYYSSLPRENTCFLLWVEAKLLAVRDGRFRLRFNAFMHEKLDQTGAYIREFSARVGTPMLMEPERLAIGLMGLCDGVQFFHTADPQNVPVETAEAVLASFFSRVVFGRDA
jgi:AcrR family transcriptional regulator